MAKILCVLYDDPVKGYPTSYALDGIPKLERYPGGQTLPTAKSIDFKPGTLLGSVSGELGLRKFLEAKKHTLVVTSDKDGPSSEFERELADAEVVISQPFWPAYLTADRIKKAKKLKLAVTAGIGSDHVDLQAAMDGGLTVAEVTYCNSISVAEHVVMMILSLVRNYIPSYDWVVRGGWNIADCVARSYDLEGMTVGTVGAGRIGLAVLRRLKPFDVKLHYTDRHRLAPAVEKELGLTFYPTAESLVKVCDVVTINTPLHPETEHMFNDELIGKMKRGAYLINTARGKICDRDAVARALKDGQLAGYAGDVWFPQPAPKDHPWRTMPHHGMTPHVSGTSLSAQARYAAGTREILECWFEGRPIRDEYLIVKDGRLAGAGAHSYSAGNATAGSEEAARFKTYMKRVVFAALTVVVGLCGSCAQPVGTGAGSIRGVVRDARTGQPVWNASVAVDSTRVPAGTSIDGTFFVPQVKAGFARVVIEYGGARTIKYVYIFSGRVTRMTAMLTGLRRRQARGMFLGRPFGDHRMYRVVGTHAHLTRRELRCEIIPARNPFHVGEHPVFRVVLRNAGRKELYLVGSLNGSVEGQRYPIVQMSISGPEGGLSIPRPGARCGTLNPLVPGEIQVIAPGEQFDPFAAWPPVEFPRQTFAKAGVFRVTFRYSTNEMNMGRWIAQGWPDNYELLKLVPRVDLEQSIDVSVVD